MQIDYIFFISIGPILVTLNTAYSNACVCVCGGGGGGGVGGGGEGVKGGEGRVCSIANYIAAYKGT